MEIVTKMVKFQEFSPEFSKLVLKSMLNHLWHLDQVNIFFSLADEDLSNDVRKEISCKLPGYECLNSFKMGVPKFPVVYIRKEGDNSDKNKFDFILTDNN